MKHVLFVKIFLNMKIIILSINTYIDYPYQIPPGLYGDIGYRYFFSLPHDIDNKLIDILAGKPASVLFPESLLVGLSQLLAQDFSRSKTAYVCIISADRQGFKRFRGYEALREQIENIGIRE